MSEDRQGPEIRKGLEGVVVDESAISKVMPETNSLTYRGYPVQDLAEYCSFEEVAFLLLHGELPDARELAEFEREERAARALSPALVDLVRRFPRNAHPMDALRTGVSFLGMEAPVTPFGDRKADMAKAVDMLAKAPTLVAYAHRLRRGQEPIPPRDDLGLSANFFHMVFGEVPDPVVVKAFDVSLILYAEHGFNASTFTARVVTSTMSDIHGAVTAAIASLKGPLHGGANEAVMHVLSEVGEPSNARPWLDAALASGRKIMGFGHRVYRTGDSRVPTMKAWGLKVAAIKGDTKLYAIADELQAAMLERKGIHPNLDFPSGPAYHLMGFETDLFTPIFAMSRISGWAAHVMEQAAANRLIRPLSAYTGPAQRAVPRG